MVLIIIIIIFYSQLISKIYIYIKYKLDIINLYLYK